jgi:hypothetical protein
VRQLIEVKWDVINGIKLVEVDKGDQPFDCGAAFPGI